MYSHYFDKMTLLLFVGLCIRSNKSLFPENDLIRASSFGNIKKTYFLKGGQRGPKFQTQ